MNTPDMADANDRGEALERLRREVEELRRRLDEAQEMIRAIQNHEVDAVVVTDAEQPRVLTLETADKPYRLLVERMQQGAATLTVDGVVLYCNERFSKLLHHPLESLVGRPIQELVDAAYLPLFEDLLRDALDAGVEGEVMFCCGDGSRAPVFLGVTALREGAAGVCMVVADLSERKWRERLEADEALARSILEQVADAVVVCDGTGTVLQASRAAHELCGIDPLHRPFERVFPLSRVSASGEDRAAVDVSPVWRGETLRGCEASFRRPNGQQAELLLSAGPLVVAGGPLLGAVITLTDITPLRDAEDELRRRAAALQEADQRKDEFLAMLAHELRNPLSPIQSSLEIMRLKEMGDPQIRSSRDVIGRQVQQLTRLVDDLLEVSRISRGKIQLFMEPIDLAAAVTRAVEMCRPMIDARGHHLTVWLPGAPVLIRADLTRLAQVIGNLLNNAAKYMENGGQIVVQAAREGVEAVIRVRDTGIGIPPHMLADVFELFTQVHRSLDRSQGGLGIGLALVKQLVTMHGGKVEAHSEGSGSGSEFVVRLPIAGDDRVPAWAQAPAVHGLLGPHLRVLVIDDNADAADTLAMLLGMLGHEVQVARDGPSGIAAAVEFRPDVVLCDIGLPLMDGYQVASRLRAMQEFERTRLVALTGYGREEDIHRSLAAGFEAHLVKPFDLEKLEAALRGAR